MPSLPAPDVAWYVEIITFFRPYFLYISKRGSAAIAVVQLGFAINLLFPIELAFICGTTKGTSLSYLKVDELSITAHPALVAFGAFSFGHPPPIAKNAI